MNLTKILHSKTSKGSFAVSLLGITLILFTLVVVTSNSLSMVNAESNSSESASSSNLYLLNDDVTQSNMTLGTPIYVESTKSTNTRVLSVDPIPTVEVSYVGNST